MIGSRLFAAFLLQCLLCLLCACSSNSSPSSDGNGACPNVSGTWKITAHCDASLIGQTPVVTQTGCSFSVAAPFNGFAGTVSNDDKITLSGPQTCTGTATASSITMTCTPGTCDVMLAR